MFQNSKSILSLLILSTLILPNLALAQISINTTQPSDTESVTLRVPLEETESDLVTEPIVDLDENAIEANTTSLDILSSENLIQAQPEVSEYEESNFFQSFDLKFAENLSITETLNGKNLYAFGGDLGIYQAVKGDLLGAAGTLTVDSNIQEDAFLVAGDLVVNSNIKGDLRALAGDISLNSTVNGDLILAAGNIKLSPSSNLRGDGIINAGSVTIEGPVSGNLIINASHVKIASKIKGNLKINADSIEFSKNGSVQGNLTYKSTEKLDRLDKYVSGEVTFKQFNLPENSFEEFKFTPLRFLLKFFFGILTTLVLTLIFAKHLPKLAKLALKDSGMKMVLGMTALISTPIMVLMLLFTFLATPLAVILMLVYVLVLALAHYLNSIFIGSYLMKRLKEQKSYQFTLLSSTLGFTVMALIDLVPVAGEIAEFLLLFLTVGVITNYLFIGLGFKVKK